MSTHTPIQPGESYEHDQPCTDVAHKGKSYAQCGHTPGPWIRDDDEIGVEVIIAGERCFQAVCTLHEPSLYHTIEGIAAQEANARLIAAAPELLEEVKALRAFVQIEAAELGQRVEAGEERYAEKQSLATRLVKNASAAITRATGKG